MPGTAKTCPFCDARRVIIDTLNYTSGKPAKFRAQCQGCLASSRWCDTEEEAWETWNRHERQEAKV